MKKSWIWIAVLFSGLCWYLSFDLSGKFWYLLWIAPVPVLLVSFNLSPKQAFITAFTAYLLGRLSWIGYLLAVLPVTGAILATVLLPLVFAFIVVAARKVVLAQKSALAALAFPVLWSAFEFLIFRFSADGTAGSVAYTQAAFLPVIQIASVTGILGITFLVTLFPSVIAVLLFRRFKGFAFYSVLLLIVVTALVFGAIRMGKPLPSTTTLSVGLGVLEENQHRETNHPESAHELQTAEQYAALVHELAQSGAQIVVLPEKMVNVTPEYGFPVKSVIANSATTNHVALICGYTEFVNDSLKLNKALAISGNGLLLGDYQKVNLFEGEAHNGFLPGHSIATFQLDKVPAGVAICKDLDFDGFMRQYGKDGVRVIFVPAWDFIRDGWLHSRMAVLRGVENGCSIVRTARQGKLTVSDYLGRVLEEASSTDNNRASLVANVPVYAASTIYSRTGDWFGYIITIAAVYFLFIAFTRSTKARR